MTGLPGIPSMRVAVLVTLGCLFGCDAPDVPGRMAGGAEGTSLKRVSLPSPYLSGYASDLKGEVLQYHSPVPMVGTSLLVRSEDRGRSISWKSGVVPEDFQGGEAVFAFEEGVYVKGSTNLITTATVTVSGPQEMVIPMTMNMTVETNLEK